MLDQYEDEYRAHASETLAKLETAESALRREDRLAPAAAAAGSLDAAREVVELLEMECGALPKAQRSGLSARVRSYRSELSDLGRRLKAVQRIDARAASAASADSIREDLFSGGDGADQANERSRMLATNDRLLAGNEQLRKAHAATIDMEERGASIMGGWRAPALLVKGDGWACECVWEMAV
jgi:predicted nuclease of restriction endonuclease-like RecB superfamily